MNTKGKKPTRQQSELLRRNNRFPDDFLFIGIKTSQDSYKNQKGNKKSLDRDTEKKKILRFKNKAEGYIIEVEED